MNLSSSPNGESAYTSKETPYETRAPRDDTTLRNLVDQLDTPIKTEFPLYSPLQGSEIRLISVQRARPDGVLRCNLFHAPLTKGLEFHALSYTWGNLNRKQKIMVNDQPLEVNENLYNFFTQIWKTKDLFTRGEEVSVEQSIDGMFRREYLSIYREEISLTPSTEALHWWIDAICINQEDIDEKNEQVPRMGQVYSSASQVWVWLGVSQELFPDEHEFMMLKLALSRQLAKQLSNTNGRNVKPALLAFQLGKAALDIFAQILARLVLERMQEDSRTNGSQNLTNLVMPEFQVCVEALKAGVTENGIRERAGFPRVSGEEYALPIPPEGSDSALRRIIRQLDLLLTSPWFERTWTIQEFVLSQNPPIALIGDYSFHCFRLVDLSWCIFHNSSTMSNVSHAGYRRIEKRLSKIFSLMNAYQWRRGSEVSFEIRKFSLLSPAHKLLRLLRLFFDNESTIPHDHIYGMLGLLDDQPPEYLKPDYRLPFVRVCQDYARFILEATRDLKIIETHKSELEACPSWVPDFRYLTAIREFHTASTTGVVRFSADGQQLTVEGIPIGKVLSCSCNHPKAEIRPLFVNILRMVNDDILTGCARITQRPLEVVFTTWFETMLARKFVLPLDSVSGIRSMNSLIATLTITPKSDSLPQCQSTFDDVLARVEVDQVVMFLMSFEYCLLETGDIAICRLNKSEPQARHHEGDAVWALKGCENLSILRPRKGGYTYQGLCQVLQPDLENVPFAVQFGILRIGRGLSFQLDEEFFAGKQLEEVTLV
jgi:hypothetical protein